MKLSDKMQRLVDMGAQRCAAQFSCAPGFYCGLGLALEAAGKLKRGPYSVGYIETEAGVRTVSVPAAAARDLGLDVGVASEIAFQFDKSKINLQDVVNIFKEKGL